MADDGSEHVDESSELAPDPLGKDTTLETSADELIGGSLDQNGAKVSQLDQAVASCRETSGQALDRSEVWLWLASLWHAGFTFFVVGPVGEWVKEALKSMFTEQEPCDPLTSDGGCASHLTTIMTSLQFFHCVAIPIFIYIKDRHVYGEQLWAHDKDDAGLSEDGDTVLFFQQPTCCQALILGFLGLFIRFIRSVLKIVKVIARVDLTIYFIPEPFFDLYEKKVLVSNYIIKGARVRVNASYADAYFKFVSGRLWSFYTLGCYSGELYEAWIDKHIEWDGIPPSGANNHFIVFSRKQSCCEQIKLYCAGTCASICGCFCCITTSMFMKYGFELQLKTYRFGGVHLFFGPEFTWQAIWLRTFCCCLIPCIYSCEECDQSHWLDNQIEVASGHFEPDMERSLGEARPLVDSGTNSVDESAEDTATETDLSTGTPEAARLPRAVFGAMATWLVLLILFLSLMDKARVVGEFCGAMDCGNGTCTGFLQPECVCDGNFVLGESKTSEANVFDVAAVCTTACGEHGSGGGSTTACECDDGFIGDRCQIHCDCDRPGADLSMARERGSCHAGSCGCADNRIGEDCSESCGEHGTGDGLARCTCDDMHYGRLCDKSCTGDHANFVEGICTCDAGYLGDSCDQTCGAHGHPDQPGATGSSCSCNSAQEDDTVYVGAYCELALAPGYEIGGHEVSELDSYIGSDFSGDYDRHDHKKCNGKPVYEHSGLSGTRGSGNVLFQPNDKNYWLMASSKRIHDCAGDGSCDCDDMGKVKLDCSVPFSDSAKCSHISTCGGSACSGTGGGWSPAPQATVTEHHSDQSGVGF
jgi:hypothetical protein